MSNPGSDDRRALLQQALQAIDHLQGKLDRAEAAAHEPIAIVGMSCRFPGGANSPEQYWELLRSGRDLVTEYPQQRRDMIAAAGVDVAMLDDGTTWFGGFLDQIDQFDPQFFGISPREAATMDPQQRLVLEVSWEALERAGIAPDSLSGSATGVFIGITTNEYIQLAKLGGPDALDVYSATGGALNAAAGRVAYTLGLQGPCMAIDTACSSSLVALHQACQSLRSGESDMALAGGVNMLLLPEAFICFNRWGMMAPDGRCKTFDAAADGFVRGEGCGVVVLKRLRDAIADGDDVLAVVRGSAVNQDGRSSGLTVPNGLAQQAVLRSALAAARVDPADVQYFEAHGTGTTLGDPIEIEAMGIVLGKGRDGAPLTIGSVKTNIGHLESASGIASVIKVVLAMQHSEIPPHLHFREASPQIPWPSFPVVVPTEVTPWPAADGRRIAGVSGFGFSGTNAHVVIESAPARTVTAGEASDRTNVLALSARNDNALRELAGRFADHLAAHSDVSLADVCATAATGRALMPQRLAVVAATTAQLRDRLHEFATTGEAPVAVTGRAARPRVAFLFTGQGAQYAGMAKALYDAEPVFHDSVDRCAELMDPLLDQPLLPVIFAEPGSSAALLLDQTAYTQPALFAVEFALVQLWQSWGIVPDALLGHSVGELVAAAVAGVFSLDDASRLVVARGALMQALPAGGAMLAVFAAEADVESVVAAHPQVAIAAVNGPEHTVVSGDGVAVAAIAEVFTSRGVRVQPLTVSHAFHSPLMQPMLAAFRVVAESVQYNPQHKPVMSNVTGAVAGAELATAAYWVQHVMAPVRFADGMAALHESGTDVFVEIGPHPVLTGMGQSCIPADGAAWAPSLRRNRNDVEHVLAAAATLFVHGAKVNWRAVRDGGDRTTLPTYPFQRHRCWIEPAPVARRGHTGGHPLLGVTTSAPALRATIHETSISVHSPSWLDGHRLGGTAVFPGSAFAEMVLAAIDPAVDVVASLQIREALVLPDDGEVRLQTIIVEQGDVREVQIVSVEATDGSERSRLHAVASVTRAAPLPAAAAVDIDALAATFGDDVDVDDYYARLREAGLTYGRAFRGLTRLLQGGACALGHAELPVDVTDATRYRLHPALFDACFHVLGAAMASGRDPTDDDMYVPIAMDGLRLHRSGATSVWCAASLLDTSHDASSVTAKVDVYGADGELVASVDRLEVRRTTRAMWERGLTKASSLLHEVVWRECPRTVPAPTDRPAGRWVIVADTVEAAQPLVDRLREGGAQRVVVIDADAPDEAGLGVALDNLVSGDTSGQLGVVSMNGIEIGRLASATGANGQVAALERTVRGPLALARWLAEHAAGDAQLWLVTRGAQSVGGEPRSLAGAAVWGLGRVVANEHPELACTCIDLDPAGDDAAFDELAAELLTGHPGGRPGEDQLAYRGRIRMVPRLVRFDGAATSPPPMPFRLVVADRGSFEHMSYAPLVRRSPDAGEIEIEVRATGVNFRDVLNVLGMYPGEAGDPGLECAGVVTAVGGGVSGLAIGDAVFGIAPRAYDSHVVTRADLVVRKPDKLTFAEAAGSTIAFLTAAFGLETLAGLRAGEKVLIHAAAGGVGLAAVGIAHRIGAEVFATVGSAEKRSMLADLGVKHIYSSRTLDFADEILADTGGAGVDVVLNSLSDEFVERSFQVLTPTGRFLEIGKGGTWSTERAAQARPHGSYHEYDLSDLLVEEAQGVRAGLAELVDDIDAGRAAPLPVSAFAAEAVQSAFRFMAEAGHIGKLVVTHRADAPRIRSDGSYLVTGGLGGLGLEVARWLVEQGARHVTLAGRSAASPEAAERIVAMEAAGATVRVVQGDVADAGDVRRIVDASVASGVPLRGVFHAAGVVDDGVLEQQTSQRFAAVFAPKVLGAAHLDEATRDADLDHFVLFSSASALLGAPGQSNYAAANSALDAVAARRRALGLPALSINWGAWGEVGMAARLPSRERQRLADRGIGLLSTSTALDALGQLMDHDAANVAVLDVDWPLLAAHAGDAGPPALLHELTAGPRIDQSRSAGAGPGLLASLAEAEPHARLALVVAHVHEHVARVLGLAADEVLDHDDELAALGLDSLMAVELTNRLRSATGLTLSTTVAFDHPSISALADHLAEALGHLPASGEHVTSHHSEHGPVAVGRDRALPASSAQYRLLFVDQFAAGLAIYNLPMVLRIRGAVDADAVRFAVDSLVRRHEALRTNFAFVDGGWVQQIVAPDAASVPFTIEEGGGDPDAFAIRLRTEGARPFDLAADVKMRCVLFSMSPDEHVLALTFHHISADGWSVTRLIVEFAELYSAAVEDRTPQLAELPLQYADWSVWQHAVEDESLYEHKLAYWTDVLGGTLPVLDLPTDHPRPAIQTYCSDRVVVDLPPELLSGVRSAARAAGVTPFVFLLAGYLATLARWSGQDDIVVGTASANRAWRETHDVVGLFANIVAIRAGVDLDQPFATLLETVKSASLGAFRHADVPFDRIVEALNPPRDLSRSMIFQTTFVLNNMPIPDVAIAGLDIEVEEVSAGATDNDLACWVTEQGDRAEVAVEYNADVFDSETVLRLFDHWQRLLASAAADPMSPAGVLTMIAPAERELVQREWAGRPASDVPQVPMRLDQLVIVQAAESPRATALVCGAESVSYAELVDRSQRLARVLVDAGVKPCDRVGVAVERSVSMVVSLLAVLQAGAAYVPLDPSFPSDRLEFMLHDADLGVVLVSSDAITGLVEASGAVAIDVAGVRDAVAERDAGPLEIDASDAHGAGVAYVIYTSGSTGRPKGVEIEHASVVNFVRSMIDEPGFGPDDVLLAVTTLSFDISVLELFVPLAVGGTVVIASRDEAVDGRRLAALIESCGATVMQATPTTWSMLFESGWVGSPRLKVLCGGEAMPVQLGDALLHCCAEVWNMFGPTETTIWSTLQQLDVTDVTRVNVPIGRPIANTTCRVLDAAGGLAPIGVPGELYIGGAGVARGYLNRPELTAEKFVDDPFVPGERLYRSGDLARWLPGGSIECLGRLDQQVKVRGYRIELGEVESALRNHPGVADAVVIADRDSAGARLLAYVIPADPAEPVAEGDLRKALQQRLPDYMIPSRLVTVDSFPLTPNRKIDRKALPRPDASTDVSSEYVAPRTDAEAIIAGIIATVLQLPRVGVHDNFFELGGHSLHATSVLAELETVLGVAMALRSFFLEPTVAAIATAVCSGSAVEALPIVRVDRAVPVPASSAQQRLLFLDQFVPGLAVFNLPLVLRLSGALDEAALRWAVEALLARHEALRTNFEFIEEGWSQIVVDAAAAELPWIVEDADGDWDDVLVRVGVEAGRPFDLRADVKLRALLVRSGDGERVLVVTMHHIAVDGWSVRRLVGELAELYASRVQDCPAVLAELPVQYLDFTVWQRGFESTASFPEQLSYWIDQLGGALPVLDLPLDRPRPPVPSYRSGTVSTELPSELLDAVRHAARAAGVTQFVFLLTGYAATLARWSGQDDFVVGTASANRSRPELDAVVGMFVDTLALRLRVEAGVPFSALLGEVRASVLGAFANHDVPFNRIVEAVNPPRDLSRPIMFQTMFVLNNMPMPNGLAIPGVTAEAVPMSAGSTEYDLSVSIVEHADRADVRVEFNADVFDRATVERFVDHWLRLLASAVADPASPAGALTMIAPAERELVLQEWAGRSTSDVPQVPMRLDQLVTMQAAASPGATALVCGAESVTYAELVDRSQRLARILIEAGVAPGDRVGVAVDRSVSMVVSLLAVLHAGAAYVPLDPAFPADRLEFMLHDADLGVVLVSSDAIVGLVEASGAVAIELSAIWDAVPVRDAGAASIEASGEPGGGVAYVIYTSGSTGHPKGVEIEHASVVNFVRSMIDEPGFGPEDVLLAVTTLSFDISVLELFVPLAVGGTVVIASRDEAVDGRRLAALIESSGTTVMQATPTTWSMLFESGWVGSPRLKVLCGGEAMPAQLGQELLHRCGEVWNMFGPTETTIWSTLQQLDATDVARVNVPIGRPISNTICRVLDTAGELVAIGVPGELFIGGAGVARGYLNRSELTAERFVPDPFGDGRLYRTGDLARWLPDGRIEYLGRLDLQVKVRGYRIELGEVESALRGEPAVSDAVVIADGEAAASRLLAYVIRADPTTPLAEGELRKALERRLPDYMIPSRFVTVDSFPLTPNRKIDRKALPRPDSIASPAAEHVAPRTDVERVVAEIVATTLRLSEVGVNDNFFELGGHSLHATSVLAKIETTFGRAIELRSFFTEPTVAATAAALTADPSTRTRVLRVAQLRVQLDAMSPEEVAAMLAARRVVGERER